MTISGGLIDLSGISSNFDFAITDSTVSFGSLVAPCGASTVPAGANLSVPPSGVATFTLRRNQFAIPTTNAGTLDANSFLASNAGALTLAITDNTFDYSSSAIGNSNVWSFTSVSSGVTKAWIARNTFSMNFGGSGALFQIVEAGGTSMFIIDSNTFDMSGASAWAPISDAGSLSPVMYLITNNTFLNAKHTYAPEHVNVKPQAAYCASFIGNKVTRSGGDDDDIYFGYSGSPGSGSVYVAGNVVPNHPHCTTGSTGTLFVLSSSPRN